MIFLDHDGDGQLLERLARPQIEFWVAMRRSVEGADGPSEEKRAEQIDALEQDKAPRT